MKTRQAGQGRVCRLSTACEHLLPKDHAPPGQGQPREVGTQDACAGGTALCGCGSRLPMNGTHIHCPSFSERTWSPDDSSPHMAGIAACGRGCGQEAPLVGDILLTSHSRWSEVSLTVPHTRAHVCACSNCMDFSSFEAPGNEQDSEVWPVCTWHPVMAKEGSGREGRAHSVAKEGSGGRGDLAGSTGSL